MALNLSGTTGIVTGNIGNSQVTSAKLASGAARANFGAGGVLQVVQGVVSTVFTGTTANTWSDITGFSASITPASASNKILVIANIKAQSTQNSTSRIMRDSTPIGISTEASPGSKVISSGGDFFGIGGSGVSIGGTGQGHTHVYLDSPSSTSNLTYKIQYYLWTATSAAFYLNATYSNINNPYTMLGISTITLVEIVG